jgi:low affinity Fe/Cu permease
VIADLQAKIDEHLKYVESRSPRFRSLEEAVAAAIKAVRDGYFAGLAENRGYLVGSSRRAQS